METCSKLGCCRQVSGRYGVSWLIFVLDSESDTGGENHKSVWKRGMEWIRKESNHGTAVTEEEKTMSRTQVRHKAADRLANSVPSILPN